MKSPLPHSALYSKLFILHPDWRNRAFTCALGIPWRKALAIARGFESAKEVTARWFEGHDEPGDFVHAANAMSFLVRAAILDEWRAAGFTGWESIPCDLRGRGRRKHGGYELLVVTGRCPWVDLDRGKRIQVGFPFGTILMREGLHFRGDEWDGSDVFAADNYGAVFVTARVERDIKRLRARGAIAEPLIRFRYPEPIALSECSRGPSPGTTVLH